MVEHVVTTFIRTKLLTKHRLKDLKVYDTVKVYVYELEKLGANNGPLLWRLKQAKQIDYDTKGNFSVCDKRGPVDFSLLKRVERRKKVRVPLDRLRLWMREQLRDIDLVGADAEDVPVYFKAFLDHRKTDLEAFFSVDAFSGRVHSPIVNLKEGLRKFLLLKGEAMTSLDVKQMQPAILGKILSAVVGANSFSDSISRGEDVYIVIQRAAGLPTRDDAKKMLFRLIFGKPMDNIGSIFKGDSTWVAWINAYKSQTEPRNPHCEDKHTNLAWLLQYSEVQVMREAWQMLMDEEIPFVTIHDDVMVRVRDRDRAYVILDSVLRRHFDTFVITIDHHS